MIIHVVSVSSGKDSQETMRLAIERFGVKRCRFVFADTGNEDAAVYAHLDYLRQAFGVEIDVLRANFAEQIWAKRLFIAHDQRRGRRNGKRIRWTNKAKRRALDVLYPTGIPFLDLCLWKGRFPSRKAQFCTQELKTVPLVEYQMKLIDQGHAVVSWQGVRRDESHNRKDAKTFEAVGGRLFIYRPIAHRTAQSVVDAAVANGFELNPLYKEGFDRVGCMPCINCGKKEISNIAERRPTEINRLAIWEWLVAQASKRGEASFFPNPDRESHLDKRGIHAMVRWSKTTRGGKQFSLIPVESAGSCSSSYGLCE